MRTASPSLIAWVPRRSPGQRWSTVKKVWASHGARDPLGAPGRSLKSSGEVLCLVRHFSVSELHDTHAKGTFAAVVDLVLGNPEVAFSHDPPHGEIRRPPRMVATQRLQILATVNYLA